jgi:hypothetical protein
MGMPFIIGASQQKRRKILDVFSDCIGAYSFRKLSSTYTGYCARIHRASDAAKLDVGFVNDYINIQAVIDFIGNEDASCNFIYDQSGNGLHLTSDPHGNRGPDIMEGGVVLQENGKIYANMIGDREALSTSVATTTLINNNISIFTVAKLTTVGTTENTFVWFPYRYWLGADKDGLIMSRYGDGTSWGQTTPNSTESWLNSWKLLTTINDGNDNQFINGQSITPRSNAMSSFTGGVAVGTMSRNPVANWRGRFMEIILYNSDKSADREAIEANINSYYSIY